MDLLGQPNGPPELPKGGNRFHLVSGRFRETSVDFQKAMT